MPRVWLTVPFHPSPLEPGMMERALEKENFGSKAGPPPHVAAVGLS